MLAVFRKISARIEYILHKARQKNNMIKNSLIIETNNAQNPEHVGDMYLDESTPIQIFNAETTHPRWMQISHTNDNRNALILVAGEEVALPPVMLSTDSHLFLRFTSALPHISPDGLTCELLFNSDNSESRPLQIASLAIANGNSKSWRSLTIDMSFLIGEFGSIRLSCRPGSDNDPTGDWLAISDLCIAKTDRLSLIRARTAHVLRSRNEIAHFSNVYRHSMYSATQNERAQIAAGHSRPVRKLIPIINDASEAYTDILVEVKPVIGESPYGYASRILAERIPQSPPNFVERLQQRANTGETVKILSLCSGAGRIEASLAAHVGLNVEWSLLDINVDLLELASKQFSPSVKLDLIEANVNALALSGETWDIILCVSALHHLVELESVLRFCHNSLKENGEFWSIGESVGRNGNRLWPAALEEANAIFSELPPKYRVNHTSQQIDQEIPDNDYSVGCFEGIRSEEIESVIDRWFHPIDTYRRNCFLWRLINLAYSDNYDLQKPEDRVWITRMVDAEMKHFRDGGRGTELFGVYKPRHFSKSLRTHNKALS
jgi:SAM-dependent methyltransferase